MQTRKIHVADGVIAVTGAAYSCGLNQPSGLHCNASILSPSARRLGGEAASSPSVACPASSCGPQRPRRTAETNDNGFRSRSDTGRLRTCRRHRVPLIGDVCEISMHSMTDSLLEAFCCRISFGPSPPLHTPAAACTILIAI